jgi:general L-amino acid transport system substrate-binding protein
MNGRQAGNRGRLSRLMTAVSGTCVALLLGLTAGTAQAGPVLDGVRSKGYVSCGVNTGLAGFSRPDEKGRWTGLDTDICRAIAAVVLGDAEKVRFTPLSTQQRFTALQSGEVDVLTRNTTWTLSRDAQAMDFGPVVYFDGQGFMVKRDSGVTSARQLDGATICVQPGTTTELNMADWFRTLGLKFSTVVIESFDELNNAFFAGRCDALTTDVSGLASVRVAASGNPDAYVILPEMISKEPLAPAVRHGDPEWADLVHWTVYTLIDAEEQGITSANVKEKAASTDPRLQRMLGTVPGLGQALGVDDKFALHAIQQVGNYGEIFERNVGKQGALKLDRGLNALWTNGGLLYAPPLR